MRTEKDIIDLVIKTAAEDEAVRAVIRTDLLPVRKNLRAYNFYFVVNDIRRFDDDGVFETCFGERALLFRGDRNYPDMFPGAKAHLMVFRDGVTIAVHIMDKDTFLARYNGADTHENVWIGDTFVKLLDKDGALPHIERLEETQTMFAEMPDEQQFIGCCNEFWWVMKTFAEYTLRRELLPAMFYLNNAVRGLLNDMLRRHIYLREGRPVDMGILDSNMERLLEPELYQLCQKTYPDADFAHIHSAREAAADLWSIAARSVAERCGFIYPHETEQAMREFIRRLCEQAESDSDI